MEHFLDWLAGIPPLPKTKPKQVAKVTTTEHRQAIPPIQPATTGYMQSAQVTATSATRATTLDQFNWNTDIYDTFRAQMIEGHRLATTPTPLRTPETLPLSDLLKTLTKGGPDRIRKFLDL